MNSARISAIAFSVAAALLLLGTALYKLWPMTPAWNPDNSKWAVATAISTILAIIFGVISNNHRSLEGCVWGAVSTICTFISIILGVITLYFWFR